MEDLSIYLRPPARHAQVLVALAAALLLFAVGGSLSAWRLERASAGLTRDIARLRAAAVVPQPPAKSRADIETEKRWTALRAERRFDWSPLFSAIEAAGNDDIELLAFQPDKAALTVILHGEARDRLAVVEFLERLSAQRIFKDAHLTFQKNISRGRLQTVAFDIHLGIVPRFQNLPGDAVK